MKKYVIIYLESSGDRYMIKYDKDTEEYMRGLFRRMDEKTRRLYAATEAMKLGHGGIKYISEILGISPKTIYNGKKDLEELKKTTI